MTDRAIVSGSISVATARLESSATLAQQRMTRGSPGLRTGFTACLKEFRLVKIDYQNPEAGSRSLGSS